MNDHHRGTNTYTGVVCGSINLDVRKGAAFDSSPFMLRCSSIRISLTVKWTSTLILREERSEKKNDYNHML